MHARVAVFALLLTACAAPTAFTNIDDGGATDSGARAMRSEVDAAGTLDSGPLHRATEHVYFAGAISQSAAVATAPWTATTADSVSVSTASLAVAVYDGVGASHEVALYFVHPANSVWELHAVVAGNELTPPSSGPVEIGSGILLCDAGVAQVVVPLVAVVAFTEAPAQAMTFSLDAPPGAHDWPGTRCWSGPFGIYGLEQDGF